MDGFISAGSGRLYFRTFGRGQPVIVLHGGPDFDHTYLLPELDRLGEACRLIYYDQRGRGRSAEGVKPEDVTIETDVEDIDRIREHFGFETAAVLGHSWGGLLALEYARRQPERVSHLILLNTAPASHADMLLLREGLARRRTAAEQAQLESRTRDAEYAAGDPDAAAAYLRVHFRPALRRPEQLEAVVARLRASFTREGLLKAWAIEERLYEDTWLRPNYDLLPDLERLRIPALVLHGEDDFIEPACAAHIAAAIPGARYVLLADCGHFSFLEKGEEVFEQVRNFLA